VGSGPQRIRAFFLRALMVETCPQFEHVIRYVLDVVKTGMKKSVSRVARSSREWGTNEWQAWQVAGRPGRARRIVLKPKSRNIGVPFS
jgi:hypothetical protein